MEAPIERIRNKVCERLGDYALCAVLFDGKDQAALEAARAQWRTLKETEHDLTYWQQDSAGGWSRND